MSTIYPLKTLKKYNNNYAAILMGASSCSKPSFFKFRKEKHWNILLKFVMLIIPMPRKWLLLTNSSSNWPQRLSKRTTKHALRDKPNMNLHNFHSLSKLKVLNRLQNLSLISKSRSNLKMSKIFVNLIWIIGNILITILNQFKASCILIRMQFPRLPLLPSVDRNPTKRVLGFQAKWRWTWEERKTARGKLNSLLKIL